MDDARHTLTVARTAARHGAVLVTSTRAERVVRDGAAVTGVDVRDLESGERFQICAGQVILAVGVWSHDVERLVDDERSSFPMKPSKGIHLVVPRDRVPMATGLITRTQQSVLFVIPWGRHWLIGTTDTPWELDRAHPAASRADIDYLLGHVNRLLLTPLTHADVEGVYAGLRPLLAGESDATARLSREHRVSTPVPGLVVVTGGKYTTYRVMARDAVDAATRGLRPARHVPDSVTHKVPLVGADGYTDVWNRREELAERHGLDAARMDQLLGRYGSCVSGVLELVQARPELAQPFPGCDDHILAEAVYAVTHEGALHLEDVLTRRTRASITAWDRGLAAAEPVARLVGECLGWSQEQSAREVEHYRLRVRAERESQQQADDLSADAARLGAPELFARYSSRR